MPAGARVENVWVLVDGNNSVRAVARGTGAGAFATGGAVLAVDLFFSAGVAVGWGDTAGNGGASGTLLSASISGSTERVSSASGLSAALGCAR